MAQISKSGWMLLNIVALTGMLLMSTSHPAWPQQRGIFQIDEGAKAYTNLKFENKPNNFQFAIIGDNPDDCRYW